MADENRSWSDIKLKSQRISFVVADSAEKERLKQCSVIDVIDLNFINRNNALRSQHSFKDWRAWGPYVSDRCWGTVREDYSQWGDAWRSFPFEHAISRAYRWSEDGIGGICDSRQRLCIAPAFWNGKDRILKERFFGLANDEGNHGEDVKECYYFVDNTPTHSYMKMIYRYPQAEFPYDKLKSQNKLHGQSRAEYELVDALHNDFIHGNYYDISIEYAKADTHDIIGKISVRNCSRTAQEIHIIEQVWLRNTWSWPSEDDIVEDDPGAVPLYNGNIRKSTTTQQFREAIKPEIRALNEFSVECNLHSSGKGNIENDFDMMYVYFQDNSKRAPSSLLFTENETNMAKTFGIYDNNADNKQSYYKDGINDTIVQKAKGRVNPDNVGTKMGAHFIKSIEPFETYTIWMRLTNQQYTSQDEVFKNAEFIVNKRISEADEFYEMLHSVELNDEEQRIQRQALAGLLWNKQFYHYSVRLWYSDMENVLLNPHRRVRENKRNLGWMQHLHNDNIISMPDKWEYPWYAAWDSAFHVIPLAMVDMQFAKQQLLLFLTEEYMHPNGQMPAYEWNYDDANPPVHAWAVWRLYCIDRNNRNNKGDLDFLQRAFHKLFMNFCWWINKKDLDGNNLFEGGFLGMDNITVFDRSHPLPTGGKLQQADGTAWMAMYSLNMLAITLELAVHRSRTFEGLAIKFFDHFVMIANSMCTMYGENSGLWNEQDGFFYDVIKLPDKQPRTPVKVQSFVGLIPLFAVETIEKEWLLCLPKFAHRIEWYIHHRPYTMHNIAPLNIEGQQGRSLLSILNKEKLIRIMTSVLDESHFLSPFGLRTLSKVHEENPVKVHVKGQEYSVAYEPGESQSPMFGGNSNWRGPIWFPVNFLMLESLQKFYRYYGDTLQLEMPTGSGTKMSLKQITVQLSQRLCRLFMKDENGNRPVFGNDTLFQTPEWSQYILFYEYFHAESGKGLGASHQTGWTALVAKLLQQCGTTTSTYHARSVYMLSPKATKRQSTKLLDLV